MAGLTVGYLAGRVDVAWNKKHIRVYKKLNSLYRALPDLLQEAFVSKEKDSLPYSNLVRSWGDVFPASAVAVYFYTDFSEEALSLKGAWMADPEHPPFPVSLRTADLSTGAPTVLPNIAKSAWITFPLQDKNTKLGFILHLHAPGCSRQSVWNSHMREAARVVSKGICLIQDLTEKAKEQNERSRSEYLRELQHSIAKGKGLERAEVCVQHWLRPKLGINSDYLDVLVRNKSEYFVFHGEVTSKGVDAILTMVILKTVIHTTAFLLKDPAAILNRINRILRSFFTGDYFASLTALYIDFSQKRVLHAKAGTSGAKHFSLSQGAFRDLESDIPLGIEKDHAYVSHSSPIESGDLWVLFSDGMVEALNEKNENFGTNRLEELMKEHKFTSCGEIMSKVKESFSLFMKEQTPQDDVSLVVLKFR